ncbi:MAG TPA: aminotransferase class I/II-fold pyridoxal phosphate-dependent enzyme, partial [Abditibacterium sp.]
MSDFLPYGRQQIDEEDIQAVCAVLRGDWLTTGPKVNEFEQLFADFCGVRHAVAVSSGTAALHCLYHAAGIGTGDEVIVPTLTFAATANAVLYCGATPIFADVEPDTLLIDPQSVRAKITAKTKAIVAVDYAGHPANYATLCDLAAQFGLKIFADACHALGGSYREKPVGSLADASTFSLHPVKPMTTGEGGMITTDDADLASKMRVFRNHGITSDHRAREKAGSWFYEM